MATPPTPTDLNFSDTNPPAPAGRVNVRWLASSPPYGIEVNINGVIETLLFRDVSASVPNPGTPGGGPATIFEIPITATYPGNLTVAHGLAAAPIFVILQMTSGGAMWLQNPVGWDATNIYLTASDAGVSCVAVCYTASADAAIPLHATAAGNFQVAHGITGKPAIVLLQMNSSGAIWFNSNDEWDATNIYLEASDYGVTGVAYAWLAVPMLRLASPFAAIALNPSAPGNFTVAHGLGKVPGVVLIEMASAGSSGSPGASPGAIWLQEPTPYDATDLYLVASDGGITGTANVWVA